MADPPEPISNWDQAAQSGPRVDPKWAAFPPGFDERHPAAILVEVLKRHRVVDATCDGEGNEDVRLLLDDDTVVMIDSDLALDPYSETMARAIGRPVPWSRLVVKVGPRHELWPFDN